MYVKNITVCGKRVSCVTVILLIVFKSLDPVSVNRTEFEWQVSCDLLVRANIPKQFLTKKNT